jgi:hypothetical protein
MQLKFELKREKYLVLNILIKICLISSFGVSHVNKTHIHGYPSVLSQFLLKKSELIGFEFEFFQFQKTGMGRVLRTLISTRSRIYHILPYLN